MKRLRGLLLILIVVAAAVLVIRLRAPTPGPAPGLPPPHVATPPRPLTPAELEGILASWTFPGARADTSADAGSIEQHAGGYVRVLVTDRPPQSVWRFYEEKAKAPFPAGLGVTATSGPAHPTDLSTNTSTNSPIVQTGFFSHLTLRGGISASLSHRANSERTRIVLIVSGGPNGKAVWHTPAGG